MVKASLRKPKDPHAPTRNLSGYLMWLNDAREKNDEWQTMKQSEVTKDAGDQWGKVSQKVKEKYEEKAAKDKVRYLKELEAYQKTSHFAKFEVAMAEYKRKRDHADKTFMKDPNRPKKAVIPFFLYLREMRPKHHVEGDRSAVVVKKVGDMWEKLSAKAKAPYIKEGEKLKAKHEKEIKKYEASALHKKYLKDKAAFDEANKTTFGKDPDLPKIANSAFVMFSMDVRDKHKKEGRNSDEVTASINKAWKDASDSVRAPYKEQAKKAKKESEAAREKYLNSTPRKKWEAAKRKFDESRGNQKNTSSNKSPKAKKAKVAKA